MSNRNSASNTMSTPQSRIKGETKEKFDALLKQALNSKSQKNAHNQSTQQLIPGVESLTSSNENLPSKSDAHHKNPPNATEIVEVDVHEDFQNDNFILNKFLNDTNRIKNVETKNDNENISLHTDDPDVIFIKPPVPRPRKLKKTSAKYISSPSSSSTFNNSYPAVVTRTKDIEAADAVHESKTVKSNSCESITDQSVSENKLPDSPTVRRQKPDSKTLTSQSSDDSENGDTVFERKTPNEVAGNKHVKQVEKSDSELITDQIKYENEIKPKRNRKATPRSQKTLKHVVENVIENKVKIRYNYEKIIGITIHKTDRLKLDSLVIHPVVKIHIVDSDTGKYLNKSNRSRPVVFYYENKDIVYITPIISAPYSLYEKRSLYPAWEETLMINDDINLLLETDNNTIIFFEVMDFVPFSVANSQFNQKGTSKGWHKISWAFLKPLGKNNIANTDKKVRLQLYYPGKHKKVLPDICDIFHWWYNKKLIKYPASLYVTVKGIIPPEEVIISLRSKTPIHGERGSTTIFETEANSDQNLSIKSMSSSKINGGTVIEESNQTAWSRSSYQMCKLPNKCVAELQSYDEGCLMLKFSNNGLYLACAVVIDDVHSIIIFSVKSHEEISRHSGHQGLIYDISWSKDDQFIITASADCTVCVWNFLSSAFVEMLPHPSYVYASEISLKSVIATGCYDEIVRIWCKTDNEMSYNLFQELEGHKGYVTSLEFNAKSTTLYSSDSVGTIIEWKYSPAETTWILKREIKLTDLRDTVINQILLHTKERRLLIHARDSALRIIDLKTGCVLYWLHGALNNKIKTMCSFSPCGNFVFVGSENGFVNVWNSDLGQSIASYSPYDAFSQQNLPVHCVQFHPYDNIVAISHYGHNLPVLLIVYDASLEGKSNVGLKMLQTDEELHVTQANSKMKSSGNLQSAVRKIITECGDAEKRQGKIKFEDILQKIDAVVSISESSRSSVNN